MSANTVKLNIEKVLAILQENGHLSLSLKGFEPRLEQQKMMHNILTAYNENAISLIEAGTGTGKSFAYLIPAILWAIKNKEKTVISTHTIALQEQLLFKDIPLIVKALKLDLKAVLVKGMNNYICKRKVREAYDERLFFPENERQEIEKVEYFDQTNQDGSRSGITFPLSLTTKERVFAENDACTATKCPYYQECHFFKARKNAADAQILIVNHHLLFADLARRAETENYEDPAVLPTFKKIIIDEAHHIEDIATEYFAENINRLNLLRIVGKLAAEKQTTVDGLTNGKLPFLKKKIVDYYHSKELSTEASSILSRLNIDLMANKHDLLTHIVKTFDHFLEFSSVLLPKNGTEENKLRLHPFHQTHPFWLQEIVPTVQNCINAINRYASSIESIEQDIKHLEDEKLNETTKGVRFEILALIQRLKEAARNFNAFTLNAITPNKVRWIEAESNKMNGNIVLNDAKLDISKLMVDYLFSKFPTIVLCSATLTSNQKFQFIRARLGLTEKMLENTMITENIYSSPFDFKKQAMLLVPTDLPDPTEQNFLKEATDKIWQAISASKGNAFILFTSYTMLNQCYELLAKKLQDQRYIPLKQGDESRRKLVERFIATDRSILFGTDSFWEGVDVAGDALRLVIIVKLPFKVPSEPIIQARTEAIRASGKDAFTEYSLPTAIVKFKQGFGRLIRNKKDRGCIVCLDSRLINKGYGKQFLNSLPNCEMFFGSGNELEKKMTDFYKKTYYLTK